MTIESLVVAHIPTHFIFEYFSIVEEVKEQLKVVSKIVKRIPCNREDCDIQIERIVSYNSREYRMIIFGDYLYVCVCLMDEEHNFNWTNCLGVLIDKIQQSGVQELKNFMESVLEDESLLSSGKNKIKLMPVEPIDKILNNRKLLGKAIMNPRSPTIVPPHARVVLDDHSLEQEQNTLVKQKINRGMFCCYFGC